MPLLRRKMGVLSMLCPRFFNLVDKAVKRPLRFFRKHRLRYLPLEQYMNISLKRCFDVLMSQTVLNRFWTDTCFNQLCCICNVKEAIFSVDNSYNLKLNYYGLFHVTDARNA